VDLLCRFRYGCGGVHGGWHGGGAWRQVAGGVGRGLGWFSVRRRAWRGMKQAACCVADGIGLGWWRRLELTKDTDQAAAAIPEQPRLKRISAMKMAWDISEPVK